MKNAVGIFSALAVLLLLLGAFLFLATGEERGTEKQADSSAGAVETGSLKVGRKKGGRKLGAEIESAVASEASRVTEEEGDASIPLTAEEKREAEENALVDAFDALTDKWMESRGSGVSMKDVDEFLAHFRKVPRSRKEECLHRALNLIPDGNVMLLAGILFDKSLDGDLLETVFNDILNRDESVKKPVMEQIFKDKTHPCWADVAWIFDVTGSVPGRD